MAGLRELRRERGLTLEALEVMSGADISTISRIERGIVAAKPETVVRLAKALGVSARRMQILTSREISAEADADEVPA